MAESVSDLVAREPKLPISILGNLVMEDGRNPGCWLIDLGVDMSNARGHHRLLRTERPLRTTRDVLHVLMNSANSYARRELGAVANLTGNAITTVKWMVAAELQNQKMCCLRRELGKAQRDRDQKRMDCARLQTELDELKGNGVQSLGQDRPSE